MGYAISTIAYGPNAEIASQALISTLKISGYEVEKFESMRFVWIRSYGKYKIVLEHYDPIAVRARIEWVSGS